MSEEKKERRRKEDLQMDAVRKYYEEKARKKVDYNRLLLYLIVGSAVALPLLTAIALYFNLPAFWLLFGLLGVGFFFPVGVLLGWWIFDPYKRAALFRTLLRKNYAVIHLVSRSGYILPLARDITEDVLIKDTAMWVLRGGKIYNLDKKNEVIDLPADKFVQIGGVPCIFLDWETKRPIAFRGHDSKEATPIEVGAVLSGWAFNQLAKALAFKRQWTWFIIGILVGQLLNLGLSYVIYDKVSTIEQKVSTLATKVSKLPQVQVQPATAETNATVVTQPSKPPIPAKGGVQVGG